MFKKIINTILKPMAYLKKDINNNKKLDFHIAFEYFRNILNSNNQALEIMADMGDKLSGNYVFDINYVKKAYSELSEIVKKSIKYFTLLSENKYPKLYDLFNLIDNRIRNMVYSENFTFTLPFTISFDDITWDMKWIVGGKNANLSEIKRILRLNVPEGFVITTFGYDEFIRYNRVDQQIKNLSFEDISTANELKNKIINGEIPPSLGIAIEQEILKLREKGYTRCAVRSSAEEEDNRISFAGQFETVLNVPLERNRIQEAYKRVIASLFSKRSLSYQRAFGFEPGRLKMAVGCVGMVDAKTSGVIYTQKFLRTNSDSISVILINATFGIGKSIVDGQVDVDQYLLSKDSEPRLIEKKIGKKEKMIINLPDGGITEIDTPLNLRNRSSLTKEELAKLAKMAFLIEKHFGKPQDIEFAIDKEGKIFILQSRSLTNLECDDKESCNFNYADVSFKKTDRILIENKGIVVQKGVGAGKVFILKYIDQLDRFPEKGILVAPHDSAEFVRVMPYASAIITDVGSPTSHMAFLSREFKIPTIVNIGYATKLLQHGQEVTVEAYDGHIRIYEGIVKELVDKVSLIHKEIENIREIQEKNYLLKHITHLNLTNPLAEDFKAEACKTVHDILRFIHEKAVEELMKKASCSIKTNKPVRLELPIPTGITVIDIGGGLKIKEGKKTATFEDITSIPLKAIIKGMMHPGVWRSDVIPLTMHDFIRAMVRSPNLTTNPLAESHIAIASREYVNLNLRFGYHLNMLNCYCGNNQRHNHIYFRFLGGATDIKKRIRRIQLIANILKEHGFNIKTKGDLLIARLANISQDKMENILDQLGRLIAYTRQLDAVLHDDEAVKQYTKNFLRENYII